MSQRILAVIAAMQTHLEQRQTNVQDVIGVQERLNASEADWCCVVITHEWPEEWQLYLVWPDGDKDAPASPFDAVHGGMVIRSCTNALSHGDALLAALGLATGITE